MSALEGFHCSINAYTCILMFFQMYSICHCKNSFPFSITAPSQVTGVTVAYSMNGSPTLNVTWTGPTGSGITYIVKYSTTNQASPPQNAREKTTSTRSVTLTEGIQQVTKYYVWVAAIKNGLQGSYSNERSVVSLSGI